MKKIARLILITFIIGTFVFIIGSVFFREFKYNSTSEFLTNFGFYQMYAFVLGFSNMYFFSFLKRFSWKDNQLLIRVVVGFLGSVIITLLGLFVLRGFTAMYFQNETFIGFIQSENIKNYGFGLWITLVIVAIFHLVYFYNRYQKNKIKEQKIIADTASAKFDALKNQLDPHFLFNSLNVLTSLIEENPEKAQLFTTSLSKVYRYVLEQKNKDLVPLDEELKFAKTYMSLLKMRFEDSLTFSIPEQSINPENRVVPLSLQLLLENAVKHNIVTTKRPLHIKIYERDNNLIVENNLQTKQVISNGSGVGLNNIKQRYKLLTAKEVIVTENEICFKVEIPMLN